MRVLSCAGRSCRTAVSARLFICLIKEIFHALSYFIQRTRQNRAFQMLFAASGKIQSYFFPINVVSIFSSFNSVLFLSPTTKTIPITSAIIDDTITWIIGCIGFYKFLPYYVRFKRRRWYRKGPVLFVDKNDVPAEDYSKLREMLKGVFLEKYYDYSAE